MHAGQLFNGVAGPIAMAAPTLISSLWFPTRQRSFATGIMLSAMSLAIAISFIVGEALIQKMLSCSEKDSSSAFGTHFEKLLLKRMEGVSSDKTERLGNVSH